MKNHQFTRREFIGTLGVLGLPFPAHGAPSVPQVNLLAMGDWGAPPRTKDDPKDAARLKAAQNRVAAAMADYATKMTADSRIDAVLPLGDNFYAEFESDGLRNATDSRFTERFENLYPKATLDVPFFFALGNHDYEDGDNNGWKHQIAYAKHSATRVPAGRWCFPAKDDATWYRKDFPLGDHSVSMLVLDTNTDHVLTGWNEQIDWLKNQLEATKDSRWRLVVAHHPMFTDGYHWNGIKDKGLYPKIRETILPKLENVVFYVSGHDHNQQHIHHPQYPHLDFLLSGAGGGSFIQRRRRSDPPYENEFMEDFGFLHLCFTDHEAAAKFIAVGTTGWKVRHAVTRT